MKLRKTLFLAILANPNPTVVSVLDKSTCGCGYCHHWVYKMQRGKFNPMLNEMDAELKDIKTPEQLYELVKSKTDDIQGKQQA